MVWFHDTFLKIVVGSKILGHIWQIVKVDCTHYTRIEQVAVVYMRVVICRHFSYL